MYFNTDRSFSAETSSLFRNEQARNSTSSASTLGDLLIDLRVGHPVLRLHSMTPMAAFTVISLLSPSILDSGFRLCLPAKHTRPDSLGASNAIAHPLGRPL